MDEDMTEEEAAEKLSQLLGTAPMPEQKYNVHTFLHNVATAGDTTKLGYLKEEELGLPKLPLRTLKELSLFCREIADMDYFADYLQKESEVLTATSLSKEAMLVKLAVIQKREIADVTKPQKINKGWFKKKQPESEEV